MATTTTPPPPKSSSTSYVIAGVAMLAAMGGLIIWKVGGTKDPEPEKPPPPTKVENKAPVFNDPPPPPPPPVEVKDAEAEKEEPKKIARSGGAANGCSGPCEGTATSAVQGALRAKGGQARGCYERALRLNPTLKGKIMVSARLGSQGQVCSASIGQNTLGDASVASCISQMFRSGKFPAPKGGCVDVNVPLNFVPRTQ